MVNVSDSWNETTVVTNTGAIRGKVEKSIWYNKSYYSYKGIPYAKPPVKKLRFKAPEPIEPWSKPINAFEYGPKSAQKHVSVVSLRTILSTCEDSLYLNVFVPVLKDTKKLPVLFYIHGGYFAFGSGDDSFQGPDFFIEHEVIVVTVNYRLGIFGFMSLGTPEYSGNMGLKDQQLALKWTYENIEAFGGD